MRTIGLLFAFICGTALVFAQGDTCVNTCAAKTPTNCKPGQPEYLGCICKDEAYLTASDQCMQKACSQAVYEAALDTRKRRCSRYKHKEKYPGQNCVNLCKNDYLPLTACNSVKDWDCLCKDTSEYQQSVDRCVADRKCDSNAVQKAQDTREKKCKKVQQ